jgi:hypothetical protein
MEKYQALGVNLASQTRKIELNDPGLKANLG